MNVAEKCSILNCVKTAKKEVKQSIDIPINHPRIRWLARGGGEED